MRVIAEYLEEKRAGRENVFAPGIRVRLVETLEVPKAFSDDETVKVVLDTIIEEEKNQPEKGGIEMASALEWYINERVSAGIDAGLSGLEGKLALAEHQWKLAEEKAEQAEEKANQAEEKAALARQLTGEALSALVVLALRLMTDEKLIAQEACERLAIQGRLRDHIMPYLVS